jgi:hypothetical protein
MNKRSVVGWVRIGVAALSMLLAVQATTGKASASVQGFTVDSITRTGLTTIQVSGTATFSQWDYFPWVGGWLAQGGTLAQTDRGSGWFDSESNQLAWQVVAPGPYTYNWTLIFNNPNGWKAGTATFNITASTWGPDQATLSYQTKSGKVILPK